MTTYLYEIDVCIYVYTHFYGLQAMQKYTPPNRIQLEIFINWTITILSKNFIDIFVKEFIIVVRKHIICNCLR